MRTNVFDGKINLATHCKNKYLAITYMFWAIS